MPELPEVETLLFVRKEHHPMISIQTKTHVGADGTLSLNVPTVLRETDVEVMLVLQPIMGNGSSGGPESRGWPPRFFERTAGAWQGERLERAPQEEVEEREALR